MEWSEEIKSGLGVALNEASLLDVDLDVAERTIRVTLGVLTIADGALKPGDDLVTLALSPVGRILASLTTGKLNTPYPTTLPMEAETLSEIVRSFNGGCIYGWDFFDAGEKWPQSWSNQVSLDWECEGGGRKHTLDLFQDGSGNCEDRDLAMRIWFDEMTILDHTGSPIDTEKFIAGGLRWWRQWQAKAKKDEEALPRQH